MSKKTKTKERNSEEERDKTFKVQLVTLLVVVSIR